MYSCGSTSSCRTSFQFIATALEDLNGTYIEDETRCITGVLLKSVTPHSFRPFIEPFLESWKEVSAQRFDEISRVSHALTLMRCIHLLVNPGRVVFSVRQWVER